MKAEPAGYELAHPVYLDVPMMTSFLAHLEGGLSTVESETHTGVDTAEPRLSIRTGARLRQWGLVHNESEASEPKPSRNEAAVELRTERHHTAASLFNLLYYYLHEDHQVSPLAGDDDLERLENGQLVEFRGEYLGNPLENVLVFVSAVYPYVQAATSAQAEPPKPGTANPKKSGNPAVRASAAAAAPPPTSGDNFGIELMRRMADDLAVAPVHDLLFTATNGLRVVVTVASEFYSTDMNETLRAGNFRVIGKVTRILEDDESINLTRRTVLGATGPQMAQELLGDLRKSGMSLDIADPIVNAPAVQVLPMAIFI